MKSRQTTATIRRDIFSNVYKAARKFNWITVGLTVVQIGMIVSQEMVLISTGQLTTVVKWTYKRKFLKQRYHIFFLSNINDRRARCRREKKFRMWLWGQYPIFHKRDQSDVWDYTRTIGSQSTWVFANRFLCPLLINWWAIEFHASRLFVFNQKSHAIHEAMNSILLTLVVATAFISSAVGKWFHSPGHSTE